MRLFKILSLALNANATNAFDEILFHSWHKKDLYYQFKDNYENKQDLQKAIDYCEHFYDNVKSHNSYIARKFNAIKPMQEYLESSIDACYIDVCIAYCTSPYWTYYCQDEKQRNRQRELSYIALKDDPFVDYITKDLLDQRQIFFCKSTEIKDAEEAKKTMQDDKNQLVIDPVSKRPFNEVEKLLTKIETYFVMEQEKLDFLLDIALLQWGAFERIAPLLRTLGYLRGANSIMAYKALIGMASMRKSIRDWQAKTVSKKNPTAKSTYSTDVLNTIFPFLGKIQAEALVHDIVLIAHGVIDQSTIKGLALEYGLDTNLVKSFFFSSFSNEILYFSYSYTV